MLQKSLEWKVPQLYTIQITEMSAYRYKRGKAELLKDGQILYVAP
jgi:hypothetical protein